MPRDNYLKLSAIEARLASVKKNPWTWKWHGQNEIEIVGIRDGSESDEWESLCQMFVNEGGKKQAAANADLICNAPSDLAFLISRVRELEAQRPPEGYAERLKKLEAAKDGAYSERNKLVAAMSKLFPASLERHDENDKIWEDDWRWIVFIDLPTGQASWHLHDSELSQFDHLMRGQGRKWDGHTNDEKYARLAAIRKDEK